MAKKRTKTVKVDSSTEDSTGEGRELFRQFENTMRLEWLDPRSLQPHPMNDKIHSRAQRLAYRELLEEVGWVDALKVNRRTGKVLDGHMRLEDALDYNLEAVPVLTFDIPAEHEPLVLRFLDAIGQMFRRKAAATRDLEDAIETRRKTLLALLAGDVDTEDEQDDWRPSEAPEVSLGLSLVPGERFDYIVLLFTHETDFVAACDHFGVERNACPFSRKNIGIGRVIDGGEYVRGAMRAEWLASRKDSADAGVDNEEG